MTPPRDVPCVGALVYDGTGRLLLVRRANPPAQGLWSLPGGRVEPGEDGPAAVAREVAEETGLVVEVGRLVGSVRRDAPDGTVYVVDDYACRVTGGTLTAGDDASDAGWFGRAALAALPTSPGLVEALTGWDALPDDVPAPGSAAGQPRGAGTGRPGWSPPRACR